MTSKGEIIYRLSNVIDPSENLVITKFTLNGNRTKSTFVFLQNKNTKKSYCSHTFRFEVLKKWLIEKKLNQNPCPLCNRRKRISNKKINGNNKQDMELEEEEEEEEEEQLPPSYIMFAIESHFKPQEIPPQQSKIIIKISRFISPQLGLFSTEKLHPEQILGLYTGIPIYTRKEVKASASDKLIDLEIWDHLVAIDGENSWAAKMNHKWEFPFFNKKEEDDFRNLLELEEFKEEEELGEEEEEEIFKKEWQPYFSNTNINDGSENPLLAGAIQPKWVINPDEELFIDYGKRFWIGPGKDINIEPVWDLINAPEILLFVLIFNDKLYDLFVISKPRIRQREKDILLKFLAKKGTTFQYQYQN